MAKTKVKLSLFNLDSIDEAIDQLNKYKNSLDKKIERFLERLAEEGVEIAKSKVQKYHAVFTTDLLNQIHLEHRDGCFFVVSDSEHTAFVEFGTGQWGRDHPYKGEFPDMGADWNYTDYLTGEHIQYAEEDLLWGDWTIPAGSYFWFYFGMDRRWHVTQGMPSRPFMFDTAMELRKERTIRRIAKEVFT